MKLCRLTHGTQFAFGDGSLSRLGALLKSAGAQRVLVVSDSAFDESGEPLVTIRSLIEAQGMAFIGHHGVIPNPHLSFARRGVVKCREFGADFVLAVGGGSTIDTAKAIALGAVTERELWDFYRTENGTPVALPEKALPVGAVVTCPNGSESSCVSVMDKALDDLKRTCAGESLRPVFAVADPQLCRTLPKEQLLYSGADLLCSLTLCYIALSQTPLTFLTGMCSSMLSACRRALLLACREDPSAAEELLRLSCMVYDVLPTENVDWSAYLIAREVSGEYCYNLPQGVSISAVLPAWLEAGGDAAYLRLWAKQEMGCATVAEACAKLREFLKDIGMFTCLRAAIAPQSLDATALEKMAQRACGESADGTIGRACRLGTREVLQILEAAC